MIKLDSPEEIDQAIKRIEENLVKIREDKYSPNDRRLLKEIYKGQLARYKQKQLSFYSDRLK